MKRRNMQNSFSFLNVLLPTSFVFLIAKTYVLSSVFWGGAIIAQETPDAVTETPTESVSQQSENAEKTSTNTQNDTKKSSGSKSKKETIFDPLTLSVDEIDVLQTLFERRKALDAREAKMQTDTGALQSVKSQIQEDLKLLSEVEKRINQALSKFSKDQKDKIQRLTKLYAQMKPKQAAVILENLDTDLAVDLLSGLSEKNAAAVLNKMNSEKAQKLLEAVVNKQQKDLVELFPTLQADCGGGKTQSVPIAQAGFDVPPPNIDEYVPTPVEDAPPSDEPRPLAVTTVKPPVT